jgi:hypothetical protein
MRGRAKTWHGTPRSSSFPTTRWRSGKECECDGFSSLPVRPVFWIRAAGTGAALRTITDGAEARRYGIELDAYRAAEARKILDEVIHGSVFETHSPVESYTMLYLNPPLS